MDLKLDTNGDLDVTDNEMTLVTGYDAIAQHLKIRLKTFMGEWFLDTRIGIPYFQEFLIKNPNRLIMDTRLREAILETPGIIALGQLNYEFEPTTRAMDITFSATLTGDTTFNFSFTELLIGD